MPTFVRSKYEHAENPSHGTLVADWTTTADEMKAKQLRALASVALETGHALPKAPAADARTLRGVPVVGVGRGAILGTRPDEAVPSKLDRLAAAFAID